MSEAQRALGIPEIIQGEIVKEKSPAEKLAENAKLAMQLQEEQKYSKFRGIHSFDMDKVLPTDLAILLEALPLGYTFPQCVMVAIEAHKYGLDAFKKEVFPIGGGVGFTVEAKAKMAKKDGYKMGIPRYEYVYRPWPKNKQILFKGVNYNLPEDMGCICRMKINDEEASYTCWYSQWFVPANPNWQERPEDMLATRAKGNCIKMATGIGESEDMVDPDTGERPAVKTIAPVAPKEIPSGLLGSSK